MILCLNWGQLSLFSLSYHASVSKTVSLQCDDQILFESIRHQWHRSVHINLRNVTRVLWSIAVPEKLIIAQIFKILTIIYGNKRFITVNTKTCHWCLFTAGLTRFHPFQHNSLRVHFIIILPSACRSSKWYFRFKFSSMTVF